MRASWIFLFLLGCTKWTEQKNNLDPPEIRYIKLPNQLQVLLISHPKFETSVVSLDLYRGLMDDSKSEAGLSRVVEKIIVKRQKVKSAKSDSGVVNNVVGPEYIGHSFFGKYKSYTNEEHSNFAIEVKPELLELSVREFSRFFRKPNFSPFAFDWVKNSIRIEFEINKLLLPYQALVLKKATSDVTNPLNNPEYDQKTLMHISMDSIKKFHEQHYSSNLMKVVIVSSMPLKSLERMSRLHFEGVPNKNLTKVKPSPSLFLPNSTPRLIWSTSVEGAAELHLNFLIPNPSDFWKDNPEFFVKYFLDHRGTGGLFDQLKNKNLIEDIQSESKRYSSGGELTVKFKLTDLGIKNYLLILREFFSYVNFFQTNEIPETLIKEIEIQRRNQIQYMGWDLNSDRVSKIAENLQVADALEDRDLISPFGKYDSVKIKKLLKHLDFSLMNTYIFEVVPPTGKISNLPSHKTVQLSQEAIQSIRTTSNTTFTFPLPNQNIATDFTILPNSNPNQEPQSIPSLKGHKIWFKQASVAQEPRVKMELNFVPKAFGNITRDKALRSMLVMVYNDYFAATIFELKLAGIILTFKETEKGIRIELDGFSQHYLKNLDDVLTRISDNLVTKEKFELLKLSLIERKLFSEGREDFGRHMQLINYLIRKNSPIPQQVTENIKRLSLMEFNEYASKFFRNIVLQGVVYGNVSKSRVQSIFSKFIELQEIPAINEDTRILESILKLEEGEDAPYFEEWPDGFANIGVYFCLGPRSPKTEVLGLFLVEFIKKSLLKVWSSIRDLGLPTVVSFLQTEKTNGILLAVKTPTETTHLVLQQFATDFDLRVNVSEVTEFQFEIFKKLVSSKLYSPNSSFSSRFDQIVRDNLIYSGVYRYEDSAFNYLTQLTKESLVEDLHNFGKITYAFGPQALQSKLPKAFILNSKKLKLTHDYWP